jgi:hypothetical protein
VQSGKVANGMYPFSGRMKDAGFEKRQLCHGPVDICVHTTRLNENESHSIPVYRVRQPKRAATATGLDTARPIRSWLGCDCFEMTTPVIGLDLWPYARSLAAWLADRRIIAAQAKLSGRLGVEKFALGAGSGISGSEWHDQPLFSIIRM